MAWVIGIAAVLFCIYLAIVSPIFRNIIGVLVLLIGAGIWLLAEKGKKDSQQFQSEYQRSLALIKRGEIDMRNPVLQNYLGRRQFSADIKNNSQHTLIEIGLKLTARDCPATSTDGFSGCETIGEAEFAPLVEIPPGQVRKVERSVDFDSLPTIRGKFAWSYYITALRGR